MLRYDSLPISIFSPVVEVATPSGLISPLVSAYAIGLLVYFLFKFAAFVEAGVLSVTIPQDGVPLSRSTYMTILLCFF